MAAQTKTGNFVQGFFTQGGVKIEVLGNEKSGFRYRWAGETQVGSPQAGETQVGSP